MKNTRIKKLSIKDTRRTLGGAQVKTHLKAGELSRNDTTIAGDKYQTDTCHVDNYG